jgi:tetratricopeptide (TPR) repeat protein
MFAAAVLICAIAIGSLDKGRDFLDRGDATAALYWFETATVENPLDAAAWRYAGIAYERLGRYSDAEKSLKQSAALLPDRETYSLLSSTYMAMGRWDEAAEAEEAAVRLRLTAEPEWYSRVADGSVLVATNISDTASRSSQSLAAEVTSKAKATARGIKRAFWK